MAMGQAAGTVAALAALAALAARDAGLVRNVAFGLLRDRLIADGALLELSA
jgi:hypothetical protein